MSIQTMQERLARLEERMIRLERLVTESLIPAQEPPKRGPGRPPKPRPDPEPDLRRLGDPE